MTDMLFTPAVVRQSIPQHILFLPRDVLLAPVYISYELRVRMKTGKERNAQTEPNGSVPGFI